MYCFGTHLSRIYGLIVVVSSTVLHGMGGGHEACVFIEQPEEKIAGTAAFVVKRLLSEYRKTQLDAESSHFFDQLIQSEDKINTRPSVNDTVNWVELVNDAIAAISTTIEKKQLPAQQQKITGTKKRKRKMYHVCGYCDKKFKKNADLERHTRIHTDEQLFSCQLCGHSAVDKGSIVRHIKRHCVAKNRSLYPYTCSECDRNFLRWPQLRDHGANKHFITFKEPVKPDEKKVATLTAEAYKFLAIRAPRPPDG